MQGILPSQRRHFWKSLANLVEHLQHYLLKVPPRFALAKNEYLIVFNFIDAYLFSVTLSYLSRSRLFRFNRQPCVPLVKNPINSIFYLESCWSHSGFV